MKSPNPIHLIQYLVVEWKCSKIKHWLKWSTNRKNNPINSQWEERNVHYELKIRILGKEFSMFGCVATIEMISYAESRSVLPYRYLFFMRIWSQVLRHFAKMRSKIANISDVFESKCIATLYESLLETQESTQQQHLFNLKVWCRCRLCMI